MFIKGNIEDIDIGLIPPPKLLSSGRMLVTDEQRQFMKFLYLDKGLSTWKIGKVMGYLNVCVINNLKKLGVELRNRSDANKTLEVDRRYFEHIDSHTKAYLLGLFYADGNIHKDSFTIALQELDKYLLESISKEIGMTGSLALRKPRGFGKQNMWALRIYDKEFCSYLRNLGVVPRKTSKLTFPTFLKKEFTYSFLHGLLDGDGCISISGHSICVCFAGSPEITKSIKMILESELKVHVCRMETKGSLGTTATLSGKAAIILLDKMYSESQTKFFLSRKRDNLIKFMKWKVNTKHGHQDYQDLCKIALNKFQ